MAGQVTKPASPGQIPRSNLMPLGLRGTKMNGAMLEDKGSNALDWLRNAKDKFRSFATGEERLNTERPRVGLALAGRFSRGTAHIGVLLPLLNAGITIYSV